MFRDLRPYVCTYEYCTEADQQYDGITDWIAHEYYNHNNAVHSPGRIYSGDCLASQQEAISRPPGLYDICREQCPICDEERPSVSHVGHHLRKIAAFTLPRSTISEDDNAPAGQDSNEANLESDEDPAEMLSDYELEDAEGLSYQNPPPPSFPQNHNQKDATPRADILSSNTVKQLDHSTQTGLLIRDYLSNLDYNGSEEDAGQWSGVISQQASVSESLGPSRPDGYDPGQTPDDRIVELQYQDMMKKPRWQEISEAEKRFMMALSTREKWLHVCQERLEEHQAKQMEMPVAQSINVGRITTPAHLSFYVRIEPLSPDYGGEAIHHAQGGHWVPPNTPNGIRNGQDPSLLLLWEDGRNIIVPANDATQVVGLDRHMYRVATIFTQHPDTPHLLTVPYNARTRGVSGRGWQCVTFNHIQVGNSNAYYSYISDRGAEQSLAAPTLRHWSPELLPDWYNCHPVHRTRAQAGLIGELPLLFALAAFSAPPHSSEVLLSSIQPGKWISHGLATGRK